MSKLQFIRAMLAFGLALITQPVIAAPSGSFDPSFDFDGIQRGTQQIPRAMALQADGKILSAGVPLSPQGDIVAVTRLNTDGSLDASFGNSGIVTTDIVASIRDQANAISVQPDGKIVVAGVATEPVNPWHNHFLVIRYNADGTLDPSFGNGGIVQTYVSDYDEAHAVAIQPDGRILVAGTAYTIGPRDDFALARYNPDGTLDATFGIGGIVTLNFGVDRYGAGIRDTLVDMALQPDGRIVLAGKTVDPVNYDMELALARYNPDGSLDATFGAGGTVITDLGANTPDYLTSMALQPDGRIVVAGYTSLPANDTVLVRYNTDGSLDASFGAGGIVIPPVSPSADSAADVAIQPDGRIVTAGNSWDQANSRFDIAVLRFNSNGMLDPGFGTGGIALNNPSIWSHYPSAMVLQPDGRIVVSVRETWHGGSNYYVARLFGSPAAVPDLKANGRDEPLRMIAGGLLDVTASLVPDVYLGQPADYWVHASSPSGQYWYSPNGNWRLSPTPLRTYAGPLMDLAPRSVLNTTTLPAGVYTITFSVDNNMDGVMDETWSNSVQVTIQ
ncbi:MAG: hypothetical protein D6794_03965 [Deltaproteobacteria bacterium]|nr:MAG: hypothetical protein D6794_03965 [Deltaproteobacteria bacterium]